MATGNLNSPNTTIWTPPMSSKDQQRIQQQRQHLQRQQRPRFPLRSGFRGRTLWDYLELLAKLALPVFIAIFTLSFTSQQSQSTLRIAQDQQQETALQTYLDRMSDLLFTEHLATSQPGDEVRQVARARTLTLLPQLNATRKGEVIQFLEDAGLLQGNQMVSAIIDLIDADLSYANLYGFNLVDADLSGANLNGAYLSYADLYGADFAFADLSGANLNGANLRHAYLSEADLYGADLRSADLRSADLSHALDTTSQQLNTAYSLSGTTMPDGSIHH
jgi:hypothetical protein